MSEQKNYAPVNIRSKPFPNGSFKLQVSANLKLLRTWIDAMISSGKEVANFGITERRAVGEKGQTHCMWEDTYKPDGQRDRQSSRPATDSDFAGLKAAVDDDQVSF